MDKKRLAVDLCVGLILAFAVAMLRDLFDAASATDAAKAICDGFFVAAVAIGGIGVLGFIRNQGAFDGMMFGVSKVFRVKWKRFGDYRESFADFQEKKSKKRSPMKEIIFAGAILLGLSIITLAVYLLVE